MGETAAEVRHDIEVTRQRMTYTLAELERKLNVADIVRDHPWASLGLAIGAGFLLSASQSQSKRPHQSKKLANLPYGVYPSQWWPTTSRW